jgi:propionyl-CoA carboxylase beta chain
MGIERRAGERLTRADSPREAHPRDEELKQAVDEYRSKFANPYKAAELGYIDEIIYPAQTRSKLIQALDMTQSKHKLNPLKKHGNIPL